MKEFLTIMVMALTLSEIIALVRIAYFQRKKKKFENSTDKKSKEVVRKMESMVLVSEIAFAVEAIAKLTIENELEVAKTFPAMWFVDMLIMNFAVTAVMVKFYRMMQSDKTKR